MTQRILAGRWSVRSETIAAWELGRTKPGIRQVAKIVALLEGDPVDHPATLSGRLLATRRRLGLTQAEMGARLDQDEKQICRWEHGQQSPHPAITGRIDQALCQLEGRPRSGRESPSYFNLTRWRRKSSPEGLTFEPKTFGDRLRARRLELGMSATFVARQTETTHGALYRIERGCQTASGDLECRLRALLALDDAR